jgi:hypothetical protein
MKSATPAVRRKLPIPGLGNLKNALGLFGILGVLAGCSALFPPNYRPYSRQVGYSDVQVAKDRFQIGYVGPADFTEIQAKKLALLRAAELTRNAGGRWFRILSQESSSRKTRLTSKEVTTTPVRDSAALQADGPKVVQEVTTRQDAWIPMVDLVIQVIQVGGAESPETLDAEALLREGRAAGLMPKD